MPHGLTIISGRCLSEFNPAIWAAAAIRVCLVTIQRSFGPPTHAGQAVYYFFPIQWPRSRQSVLCGSLLSPPQESSRFERRNGSLFSSINSTPYRTRHCPGRGLESEEKHRRKGPGRPLGRAQARARSVLYICEPPPSPVRKRRSREIIGYMPGKSLLLIVLDPPPSRSRELLYQSVRQKPQP